MMKFFLIQHWRRILLWLGTGMLVIPAVVIAYVFQTTHPYRYTQLDEVPARRVALVLGAGVRPDGSPSRMLAERVQAGVELYERGQVQKLLMTGDNSRVEYNEVEAMKLYAVERGVPAGDITLDYAGFRTYDSCYRARDIFGVNEAVVVTQQFHLARSVYTCRQLGINAVGLGTPDWGYYPASTVQRYTVRDIVATLYAIVELHITHPLPKFLGPYEGIT